KADWSRITICFVYPQIPKSSYQEHLIGAIELIVIGCKFFADRNTPGFQSPAQKNFYKIYRLPMNNLIDSLAATTLAVVIVGAVPTIAGASEKALLNPVQLGTTGGLIVFAEKETKPQHRAQINVMLKGYDPVAYFKQGKAVRGKRSIWST